MKKAFGKYVIECALIFISVISAFFVENLRDNSQQKEKELNLLRDITTDLTLDTVLLQNRIRFGGSLSGYLTDIIKTLENPHSKDTIDDYALKYSNDLALNKTTYEGIKNTSGFTFIKDKDLVTELSDYYNNREDWIRYNSTEMAKIDGAINQYLRTETRFVDLAVSPGGISYSIDPASLSKLRRNQLVINLCYEKRAKIGTMTFLLDSLKRANIALNKKCLKYLSDED